jgi:hypothetical protein
MEKLEIINNKIHLIRNQKVMLDFDLAFLYQIETKVLKQAVRRNIERFPKDFMFELTEIEFSNLRTKFSSSSYGGLRYMPFAFTEQGVAMLSSVLNSKKAIEINIAIMRTFVVLRNSILSLEEITKKVGEIEQQFPEIYNALNYLMDTHQKNIEQKERSQIGFSK